MEAWFGSLPPWLYWTLLSPAIAFGFGVVMKRLVAPGSRLFLPEREATSELGFWWPLLALAVMNLGVGALGLVLLALLFLPALLYREVLGWSLEVSLPLAVFTSLGLFVVTICRQPSHETEGPSREERIRVWTEKVRASK